MFWKKLPHDNTLYCIVRYGQLKIYNKIFKKQTSSNKWTWANLANNLQLI